MPISTQYAGGRAGVGAGRVTWRGGVVRGQIDDVIQGAMDDLAGEILDWLHQNLHRVTGDMVNKAFATVAIESGRRVVRLGSSSDHALDHELGNAHFGGHPQFREAADLFAPRLTPLLRARFAAAGA